MDAVELIRSRIRDAVLDRVAGPDRPPRRNRGAGNRHAGNGHTGNGHAGNRDTGNRHAGRWFAEGRPIRSVHRDSSVLVGGIRALLLQSLHPLAMAAVAEHSGYRGDPWGRLQRTSYFLAVTTFGAEAEARAAIARVRAIHEHVTGIAPDGRPYAASDPVLLEWVHIAEVDSFLRAHSAFGADPLDQRQRDEYVADMARIAVELGVPDPPRSQAQLAERLAAYRPQLAATPAAREAARFLLLHPPLPLTMRAPYGILASAAVSLLPRWARRPLLLPTFPVTEALLVRPAGYAMVRAIGWATSPPSPGQPPT